MSSFLTEILKTLERSQNAGEGSIPVPHFAAPQALRRAVGETTSELDGQSRIHHPQSKIDAMIRIYNTLTKNKETLEPVRPGKVGIYLC